MDDAPDASVFQRYKEAHDRVREMENHVNDQLVRIFGQSWKFGEWHVDLITRSERSTLVLRRCAEGFMPNQSQRNMIRCLGFKELQLEYGSFGSTDTITLLL